MQRVRFFEDEVHGQRQLLFALAFDREGPDRGQMREAVRLATEEDIQTHPAAYEAFLGRPPDRGTILCSGVLAVGVTRACRPLLDVRLGQLEIDLDEVKGDLERVDAEVANHRSRLDQLTVARRKKSGRPSEVRDRVLDQWKAEIMAGGKATYDELMGTSRGKIAALMQRYGARDSRTIKKARGLLKEWWETGAAKM
jgi:hypothetical protein